MATWAIGDVQGCDAELGSLLALIGHDPARDLLWFTGDLVNRGPDSLAVLRRVRALGDRAVTVLGNHDIHLLALALAGAPAQRRDTLAPVLAASDAAELIDWLRRRPLLHTGAAGDLVLVHAGLAPQWRVAEAEGLAAEVAAALAGPSPELFLADLYGDEPSFWDPALRGTARLRFITNCCTRMRYCDATGRVDLRVKGAPGTQPAGLMPWYEVPYRRSTDRRIVFGHWSTHGLTRPDTSSQGVFCIDTGCCWGGALSALNLETLERVQVPCRGDRRAPQE